MTDQTAQSLLDQLKNNNKKAVSSEEREKILNYIKNKSYNEELEPVDVKSYEEKDIVCRDTLVKLYRGEKVNASQLAILFDVTEATIHNIKQDYNIYQFTSKYLQNCNI